MIGQRKTKEVKGREGKGNEGKERRGKAYIVYIGRKGRGKKEILFSFQIFLLMKRFEC